MALSEPEQPLVFVMVLALAAGVGLLVERLLFVAASAPVEARVLARTSEAVEIDGTLRDPRSHEVDYTAIAVAFEDAQGRSHIASELSYFFAPAGERVAVRWREGEPPDVRRAGFDLLALPLVVMLPIVPLELLRRWLRRRSLER